MAVLLEAVNFKETEFPIIDRRAAIIFPHPLIFTKKRWAIKEIAGKDWNLPELLQKESELVEKIAEDCLLQQKSRMNYRAWYHRSWLVSYMTKGQVLDELDQSRKWTELHVADNCCFHYRRRLMVQLLAGFKENLDPTYDFKSGLLSVWKG
ncbi:hypothetical protein ACLOJK_011450 [Asimina triloba]